MQWGGVGGEVATRAVVPHLGLFPEEGAQGAEFLDGEMVHDGVAAIGQLEVDGRAAWLVVKVERVVFDFFPHGECPPGVGSFRSINHVMVWE